MSSAYNCYRYFIFWYENYEKEMRNNKTDSFVMRVYGAFLKTKNFFYNPKKVQGKFIIQSVSQSHKLNFITHLIYHARSTKIYQGVFTFLFKNFKFSSEVFFTVAHLTLYYINK